MLTKHINTKQGTKSSYKDNLVNYMSVLILPFYFLQYDEPFCKWNIFMFLLCLGIVILILFYTMQEEKIEQEKIINKTTEENKLLKKIIKQGYHDLYITFSKVCTIEHMNSIYNSFNYVRNTDSNDKNNRVATKCNLHIYDSPIDLNKLPENVELHIHLSDDIKADHDNDKFKITHDWYDIENEDYFHSMTSYNIIDQKVKSFVNTFSKYLDRTVFYCSSNYNTLDLCLAMICKSTILPNKTNNQEIKFSLHSALVNKFVDMLTSNINNLNYNEMKNIMNNKKFELIKFFNSRVKEVKEKEFGKIFDDLDMGESEMNTKIKTNIKSKYNQSNIIVEMTVDEINQFGYGLKMLEFLDNGPRKSSDLRETFLTKNKELHDVTSD